MPLSHSPRASCDPTARLASLVPRSFLLFWGKPLGNALAWDSLGFWVFFASDARVCWPQSRMGMKHASYCYSDGVGLTLNATGAQKAGTAV